MLATIAPCSAAENSQYKVEINILPVPAKSVEPSNENTSAKNIDFKDRAKNIAALNSGDGTTKPKDLSENEAEQPKADPEEVADNLKALITDHLTLIAKLNNPRLSKTEWQRLVKQSNDEIKSLLATEGYFSPTITQSITQTVVKSQTAQQQVTFTIQPNRQALVKSLSLNFTGAINTLANNERPNINQLNRTWRLKVGMPFTQSAWSDAKKNVLTRLLSQRFPRAKITKSEALVNPETREVDITVNIDSGDSVYFGELTFEGLNKYPESMLRNLNKIQPGSVYTQTDMLTYQAALLDTNKFSSVEVRADTSNTQQNGPVPVIVKVVERKIKTLSLGLGASTNTGARVQASYTNRNLFERGLLWETTTKLEQRAQSATSSITFPADGKGYRDSINNSLIRTDLEGQITTAINNGIKRTWVKELPKSSNNPAATAQLEQFVGANLLYEFLTLDNTVDTEDGTQFNKSATLAYGFTLRKLNNDISPTNGFILSTQFQVAPLEQFSDGRFLQSQAKIQGYYKIAKNTQWIGRLEAGMVTGSQSVPATYLFRAGGDQSVRGYNFQSLGIQDGDTVLGGRVLLTGSTEFIQWLTPQWGAAAFVDFGNAAQSWDDYEAAYGYGLGVRWKSPVGPVGIDLAYGEAVEKYRIHFNLGVNF